MNTNYRKSHMEEGKGRSYNKQFSENSYRSLLWEMEQEFLDDIIKQFFPGKSIKHLDFACGAGRIISHVEDRTHHSVGVDVSSAMIEVARENVQQSKIVQGDITSENVLNDEKFNLITAFRFFPNAEAALRDEAMAAIVKHLEQDGLVVFNNHKNLLSTRNRMARLVGRGRTVDPSLTDVFQFVEKHGLRIKHIYHTGVLPSSEKALVLPKPILLPLERALSKIPALHRFGEDLVFVCSR